MFDSTFDLSKLDGTNGFVIPGLENNTRIEMGQSVNTAGDMNGDGKDDLVVFDRSAVYVIFGQAHFPASFNLTELDGNNGFVIDVASMLSVSSGGDVNGDGKSDLILGGNKMVYTIFGQANFSASFDLKDLDGTNGFVIPVTTNKQFVSSAGDMNGDGKDDIVFGSNANTYVIFGQTNFSYSFNLTILDGTNGFVIPMPTDLSAYPVSTVGDMNGDGKADLVVGCPNAVSSRGIGHIIFGQTNFSSSFDLNKLDGKNGFTIPSLDARQPPGLIYLGECVGSAGDINGDKKDDAVLCARVDGGRAIVYVIYGKKNFTAKFDLTTLNKLDSGVEIPMSENFLSPTAVRVAGDMNGDGKDDLALGSYTYLQGVGPGRSYVVFGAEKFVGASIDLSKLRGSNGFAIPALGKTDRLGWSVSTAGDMNGDGVSDVVLGAPGIGSSYVIFGKFPIALVNNQISLTQGKSLRLNSENLSADDLNGFPEKLQFNMSNIHGGQFEYIHSHLPIQIFNQQEILNEEVYFIQDGSSEASYEVSVTNGAVSTKPVQANVTLIPSVTPTPTSTPTPDVSPTPTPIPTPTPLLPPKLLNNQLIITQDQSVILNSSDLSAVDFNNIPVGNLSFTVSEIKGGQFELITRPNAAITTFVQQKIIDLQVRFVQDGSKSVSYEVSVSNGNGLYTPPAKANVTFIRVYHAPKLNNPIPDQSAEVNMPFNIQIADNTFIDPDGDFNSAELIYSARQADGEPLPDWIEFKNKTLFTGNTSLLGKNQFSLFATNPCNKSAISSTNFTLEINEASNPITTIAVIASSVAAGFVLIAGLSYGFYKKWTSNSGPRHDNEKTALINQIDHSLNDDLKPW